MSARKIQSTKNYALFSRSEDNRPTDLKRHRRLLLSMEKYGFLPSFPIVCFRDPKGNLTVKDGQHRLQIAEKLGLTVHWIEEAIDFDIAVVNSTAKIWVLRDYAQKFATNGKTDYQYGLDFAAQHGLPIGIAFALLGGTTSFTNVQMAFIDGTYKVKDQKWADAVAEIYVPLVAMAPAVNNVAFITACMATCRVAEFEAERLLQNAGRCRDKLQSFSTREAYLDMLEEIYNYGRKQLLGLKALATMAMRDRSAARSAATKKPARKAVA
jgi:hypothetical protein